MSDLKTLKDATVEIQNRAEEQLARGQSAIASLLQALDSAVGSITTPEYVWMHLIRVMGQDNGGEFAHTYSDFVQARDAIVELAAAGYFKDSPDALEGSYWRAAAGEETEALSFFNHNPAFLLLSDCLNTVFERGSA